MHTLQVSFFFNILAIDSNPIEWVNPGSQLLHTRSKRDSHLPIITVTRTTEMNPDLRQLYYDSCGTTLQCAYNGQYIRDSCVCRVFYHCANGKPFRKACSSGLIFDTNFNVCNWPSAVDCQNSAPTTTTVATTSTTVAPSTATTTTTPASTTSSPTTSITTTTVDPTTTTTTIEATTGWETVPKTRALALNGTGTGSAPRLG